MYLLAWEGCQEYRNSNTGAWPLSYKIYILWWWRCMFSRDYPAMVIHCNWIVNNFVGGRSALSILFNICMSSFDWSPKVETVIQKAFLHFNEMCLTILMKSSFYQQISHGSSYLMIRLSLWVWKSCLRSSVIYRLICFVIEFKRTIVSKGLVACCILACGGNQYWTIPFQSKMQNLLHWINCTTDWKITFVNKPVTCQRSRIHRQHTHREEQR